MCPQRLVVLQSAAVGFIFAGVEDDNVVNDAISIGIVVGPGKIGGLSIDPIDDVHDQLLGTASKAWVLWQPIHRLDAPRVIVPTGRRAIIPF